MHRESQLAQAIAHSEEQPAPCPACTVTAHDGRPVPLRLLAAVAKRILARAALFLSLLMGFCCGVSQPVSAQPSFSVPPYLQNVTETSIVVCWQSDEASDGTIEYWVEGSSEIGILSADIAERHEALLADLQPGTAYRYCVKIPAEGAQTSYSGTFLTAPTEETPFSFVVYGDTRGDGANHRAVVAAIRSGSPAFVIHTGDLVSYGDSNYFWGSFWGTVGAENGEESLVANSPFYPVLGNHEYMATGGTYKDEAITKFQSYFVLPENGLETEHPEWTDRFYSFRYGPVYVIVLDVNNDSDPAYDLNNVLTVGPPDIHPGSPQYEWLLNQLKAARECAFTFVCFHHSPYSTGHYGPGASMKMRFLDPLFRQHGVDAVFTSHDHLYERCETYAEDYRIVYFVAGAGGAPLYERADGWDEPGSWIWDEANQTFYTKSFDNTSHSFIKVDMAPLGGGAWEATFLATRPDGEVFDSIQIRRPWGHIDFGDSVKLAFESTAGRTYQAEYSNGLPEPSMTWQAFGAPVLAVGPFVSFTDDGTETGIPPTDSSVSHRFYRILELP